MTHPAPITLIHLISEQPMANLLPLMAVRPDRVIQITSNQKKFCDIAAHLERAAHTAGITATFEVLHLHSKNPQPSEVATAIQPFASTSAITIANVTGGTKLMSLGAYLAASETSTPVLYCDTQEKQFLLILGEDFPTPIKTFSEVAAELSVPIIMSAHGKAPDHWKFDSASATQVTFGKLAWDIRSSSKESFDRNRFGNPLREFFRSERGKIPSRPDAIFALSRANILDAFSPDPSPEILQFFNAATQCGFLQSQGEGFCVAALPAEKNRWKSHLEKIANLLDGSWLELSVLHFAYQSKRYRDIHWSVEPSSSGSQNADFGETDVVAVNVDRASLEVISCKTGLTQPLEHIEGLRTRANQMGGNHAMATLAIFHADQALVPKLRQWGDFLKVRILIGEEIPAYFCDPA